MEKNDITGVRFGRLVATERVSDAILPNGKKVIRYKCKCDCGNEKVIRKCHLTSGSTVSCGCLRDEKSAERCSTHKHSQERLYNIWLSAKDRCFNTKSERFNDYGGRGISMCDEWKRDYLKFREWCLSNGYVEDITEQGRNNVTLDRINVNGNYEPSNCRFISNSEQALNKRNTLTENERYKKCPICNKSFVAKRRSKKTCSMKCGYVLRLQTLKGAL